MDEVSNSHYICEGETTLFHYSVKKNEIPSSSQKVQSSFCLSPCPLYSCENHQEGTEEVESGKTEGGEKGGREDQAGMTCLHSGILNICRFKKIHRNRNRWENITSRLTQKVNLELFSLTRTMKYQMPGNFLDAAEKVKYLHSTRQFTLTTTFVKPCQKSEKNHGT